MVGVQWNSGVANVCRRNLSSDVICSIAWSTGIKSCNDGERECGNRDGREAGGFGELAEGELQTGLRELGGRIGRRGKLKGLCLELVATA
jgi:hypothetical protein